jgi:hypothetical protein
MTTGMATPSAMINTQTETIMEMRTGLLAFMFMKMKHFANCRSLILDFEFSQNQKTW